MLVWIDIETTGLDPQKDAILEVASVITDDALAEVARFEAVISREGLRTEFVDLDPAVRKMHTDNGLWEQSGAGGWSKEWVDRQLSQLIKKFTPEQDGKPDKPQLAGSSVHFDRSFLRLAMPLTDAALHYRHLDVSALNEFARRFCPGVWEGRPNLSEPAHRAMPDILNSIEVCRYYSVEFRMGLE